MLKELVRKDPLLFTAVTLLIITSFLILRSIAPFVFPVYFAYYALAVVAFLIFSRIDFEVISVFFKQIYVLSLVFLLVPLIIGQVTRGAVRWVPLGPLTLQPSELVRPFLILFFANFLKGGSISFKKLLTVLILLALPVSLILAQPSLGVATLTCLAFLGVLLASNFSKKILLFIGVSLVVCLPLIWLVLAPYQKDRVFTFLYPFRDPSGAGYNSIQSTISVGSGRLEGRGLGEGGQTQLSFLPERHTDFIFASVAEELGFAGSIFLILASFFLLLRIIECLKASKSQPARLFISGVFLTLFAQTIVHMGMNMGLFPITGVPLPLVSAGGSSLIATMIALGMVMGAKRASM